MNKYFIVIVLFLLSSCISTKNQIIKRHGKIKVTGVAIDAKAGALIKTKAGSIFYIDGLNSWGNDKNGKEIIVEGKFITVENKPRKDSLPMQQVGGVQRIIKKAKIVYLN
jgi:uncharacterized membrane protein YjjP (DUF1212 family)